MEFVMIKTVRFRSYLDDNDTFYTLEELKKSMECRKGDDHSPRQSYLLNIGKTIGQYLRYSQQATNERLRILEKNMKGIPAIHET
jgi:L-rhamnose isomerase